MWTKLVVWFQSRSYAENRIKVLEQELESMRDSINEHWANLQAALKTIELKKSPVRKRK